MTSKAVNAGQRVKARHPFAELVAQYRARKPGLTQTGLAELAGYDQAILVRMLQGKKDMTGPSGRERVVRLIETLADQNALTTLDEANALLLAADMPPLFERQPIEARLIERLARLQPGHRIRRTNLPAPLTSFVGRAQEIAEARRLLNTTRLLTLMGAGGSGKTRLAQRIAADVLIAYSEGVWYAELAALTDLTLIADEVVRALGLVTAGRPALDQLCDYLRERHVLLVLDNCEHLIDGIAGLAVAVLRACPRVTILTTSREALNVEGEITWRVPPMQPDEAGQLFVDRAAAARTDIHLSAQDMTVAHICQRLDGMPLAIELAAARISVLSLTDIAARLEDRFSLLVGGRRGALPRHQTLRALIDWSYDALSEQEQVVFRRLGVFVGGWSLAQAEQVMREDASSRGDLLSRLGKLMSKSLVVVGEYEEGTRYHLLETLREYAIEKLAAHGEVENARQAHAQAFCNLAEQAELHLNGKEKKRWLLRLEHDHDNFRAALGWAVASNGATGLGLRLAAALADFWNVRGYLREGRAWLKKMLDANAGSLTETRAHALLGAGGLAGCNQENDLALALMGESLALYQALGNKRGAAQALGSMALTEHERAEGDTDQVRALSEQALALYRELDDLGGIAFALGCLSDALKRESNYAEATRLQQERLALYRRLEDSSGVAWAFSGLGWLKHEQGADLEAIALADEALALLHEDGDKAGINYVLFLRSEAALKLKEYDLAMSGAAQQLASYQAMENPFGIALALGQIGWIEFAQRHDAPARTAFAQSLALQQPEVWPHSQKLVLLAAFRERLIADGDELRAAQLSGFMESHLDELDEAQQASLSSDTRKLLEQFSETDLNKALAEGRDLSLDEAVALATL